MCLGQQDGEFAAATKRFLVLGNDTFFVRRKVREELVEFFLVELLLIFQAAFELEQAVLGLFNLAVRFQLLRPFLVESRKGVVK